MGRTHAYRVADFLLDISSTFSYAWKDIEPQLRALADQPGSPYDGVAFEMEHAPLDFPGLRQARP